VVAFVRVTRDKRGYEHIYLMRGAGQRGKGGSPRVLYVFRTPPGIRVGREPFDETVRRTLEEQNPGVHFDWQKLSVILPPPPDVEYWRERRRAEKAAKQSQREEKREETAARDAASSAASAVTPLDESLPADEEEDDDETNHELASSGNGPAEAPAATVKPADSPAREGQRRRRRRRGGRGRRRQPRPEGLAQAPADPPNSPDDPSKER
jgi:ribonuclease E